MTLLDTTKEDSLDWTRYPFGPQSATPGVSPNFYLSHFLLQDTTLKIEGKKERKKKISGRYKRKIPKLRAVMEVGLFFRYRAEVGRQASSSPGGVHSLSLSRMNEKRLGGPRVCSVTGRAVLQHAIYRRPSPRYRSGRVVTFTRRRALLPDVCFASCFRKEDVE